MNKKVTWSSPSNIALVKYWGKFGNQLPMNPSISLSLDRSKSLTSVELLEKKDGANIKLDFYFEGKRNENFGARIGRFIGDIAKYFPALQGYHLKIDSSNTFPHSSGIASSASAMSALALCLCDLEKELTGEHAHIKDFYKKASFISRLGSGSASRSVYGGVVLWGQTPHMAGSSKEFSIDINSQVHPVFKSYGDAILIVSDEEKKVSSSVGHGLMKNHPYATQKFEEAEKNTTKLLDILKNGDQVAFAKLVEQEALALHAMMMTSTPPFLLMEANTVAVIGKVNHFREQTGIPVCFTLDAGANVHLLYPKNSYPQVKAFIESELLIYCKNGFWIDDKVGKGPEKISPNEIV